MKRIHLILIGLLIYVSGNAQELEKFSENGKYGFRNEVGNVVVPAKYDETGDFSEGLAAVELNGKWGYIDKTGKVVIPLKYQYGESFSGGYAKAGFMSDTFDYLDQKGTPIFRTKLNPYIKNAIRLSKKNSSTGAFKVEGPYLIVNIIDTWYGFIPGGVVRDIEIVRYSEEKTIDPQIINNVKTLIVRYDNMYIYKSYYKNYESAKFQAYVIQKQNYYANLIYFDMETKKCIGRDNIAPASLPDSLITTDMTKIQKEYIPFSEVMEKVESHLATPSK